MKKSKKFEYLKSWELPTPEQLKDAQDQIVKIMNKMKIEGNFDLEYMTDGGPWDMMVNVYTNINGYRKIENLNMIIHKALEKVFDYKNDKYGRFTILAMVRSRTNSKKFYKDRIDF